jgi:hypothetical protein
MPIIDKFKDMGTVVMGKVESGSVTEGDTLLVMPNKVYTLIFFISLLSISCLCCVIYHFVYTSADSGESSCCVLR